MSTGSSLRLDTPSALAAGTRLGEFELKSLLGVGGFGIVYLAFDHALEREVAVKEYMPASLVGRTETMHVSLRSQSDAEVFSLGLRSFVNEAKLLARFDHPSLLKVYRFWEANGTAYMAMPVLRGRTLKELRQEMSAPPEEAWLRNLLMPLLGAIEKLHSEGVYHRDIAPDNIQIEPDGRPVLMDFGAARRVLSDKSQALTAILKPAYAPIEQYGEAGSVKQGPWTDLYALGATLHYMLLARPPAPATTRTVHDEGTELTTANLPGYSALFLDAIDWMLCPRPADRPQSVAKLRDVLEGRAQCPARRVPDALINSWEDTNAFPPDAGVSRLDLDVGPDATQLARPSFEAAPTVPAGGAVEHVQIEPTVPPRPPAPPAERTMVRPPAAPAGVTPDVDLAADRDKPVAPAKASSKLPLVLGGLLAVAVAAGVALWPRAPAELPAPAPAASASAQPVATPAPAPAASALALPAAAEVAASAASAPLAELPTVVPPPSEPVKTVEVPAKPVAGKPAPPAKAPAKAEAKPEPKPKPEPVAPPPAAAPAPIPESTTPGPACGPREGIRYHVCMERECSRPDFASHSACLRWKQDAKRD